MDNSLLNKKGDSFTTKPSDNDKIGNLPIFHNPLTSVIHAPSPPQTSSAYRSDNPRLNVPQQLANEVNRRQYYIIQHPVRFSSLSPSLLIVHENEERRRKYIQDKLDAIKFSVVINQGHGLPFQDQQQQKEEDAPFGLLCRGLSS